MGKTRPDANEVVSTGAACDAEVRGVDLSKPLSNDTVARIAEARTETGAAVAK